MAARNLRYIIIEAGDPLDLSARIEINYRDGWLLQGGVFIVALGDDQYLYAQAMARYPIKEGELNQTP